ncbi:MAG: N-formylglutamate amidohydrolase [Planctomycetaceae bacterium]|nr:N-formylglutamate amidohydrolase [Planctomycetaceae bacterium]
MERLHTWLIVVAVAAAMRGPAAAADERPQADRLIVAEAGTIPVLLTAPHGGRREIPGVISRTERPGERVNTKRDEETSRLAFLTADAIQERIGKRPYLVVAEFSRKSLDANRPEATAYQQAGAAASYRDYHDAIARFTQAIRDEWKHGLLIDLHAQWQYPDTVMRGTRDGQTIRGLIGRRGWDGLLGPDGVMGTLAAEGLTLYPPAGASEGNWTHVGSYTVAHYSRDGIDGVQLEIGSELCDSEEDVRQLARQLAVGIERHLRAEGQIANGGNEEQKFETSFVAADEEGRATTTSADLTEAEQAFVKLLTNSVLVGRFSVDGAEGTDPKPERYTISKVTKVGGDDWIVEARITYGQVDIPVPVPVKVNWAGDTPVISLTNLKIPGLGDGFTTRVLFYEDRYAGSWYHGKVGGHMWGKIEQASEPAGKNSRKKP